MSGIAHALLDSPLQIDIALIYERGWAAGASWSCSSVGTRTKERPEQRGILRRLIHPSRGGPSIPCLCVEPAPHLIILEQPRRCSHPFLLILLVKVLLLLLVPESLKIMRKPQVNRYPDNIALCWLIFKLRCLLFLPLLFKGILNLDALGASIKVLDLISVVPEVRVQ